MYLPERQRIVGPAARRTQRLQRRAAQRGWALQLAYGLSMSAAFLVIVGDALAKAPGVGP